MHDHQSARLCTTTTPTTAKECRHIRPCVFDICYHRYCWGCGGSSDETAVWDVSAQLLHEGQALDHFGIHHVVDEQRGSSPNRVQELFDKAH